MQDTPQWEPGEKSSGQDGVHRDLLERAQQKIADSVCIECPQCKIPYPKIMFSGNICKNCVTKNFIAEVAKRVNRE